jgi:hypothetical protein
MKQTSLSEPRAQVFVADGEVTKNQPFEAEFVASSKANRAVVLVETLTGDSSVSVNLGSLSAEELEELSRFKQVHLRFMRLAGNARTLSLKITSTTKALVRVTVAFLKSEVAKTRKAFSCRMCKQLCRLAVSALLAHFGIPYLDAEATADLPAINPPNETTGGIPVGTNPLKGVLSPDGTVPVDVGNPVPVGEQCKAFLGKPDTGPTWLKDLFDAVDPKMIAGVRFVLEVVEWVFDAPDRIYGSACQFVGMCKPEPA